MKLHKRVLICNRGEIAIRIARAASELGMESVAVYPPADALSLHPRFATQCFEIGAVPDPVAAYLDIDAMIEMAKRSGCDCVHPGYGFLSENAEFARRCQAEELTFVGPSADTLALFGNKPEARKLARTLDIPIVPGGHGELPNATAGIEVARQIGYPVMLKAAAGGGGRGMRAVRDDAELDAAFERCRSEAQAAFGNGDLFVEKLIERPRHIEVQVLADHTGEAVHLFERDCSVQLRNQKVIEIAPAPNLSEDLRTRIFDDAIRLMQAAGYVNAGTVEFLIAPEQDAYYFIECNPRLQVEHTVTEEVTGVDLVTTQFHLAGGNTLGELGLRDQSAIRTSGFSIQSRVVVTSPGIISAYRDPSGPGIRVDGCGYAGYAPDPSFDPLLAKLVCTSRAGYSQAVTRSRQAIEAFQIRGIGTNLNQLHAIVSHPDIAAGDARTTLLTEYPDLMNAQTAATNGARQLLDEQAARLSSGAVAVPVTPRNDLPLADGDEAVICPMQSSVVELSATAGMAVMAGDAIMVVSAMKMETVVTAPCAGTVSAIAPLKQGDGVAAGQIVAGITPGAAAKTASRPGAETWAPVLEEVTTLHHLARERLAEGSEDPGVVRQRNRGKLTCRERIDLLLDEGSFREVGSIAGFASYDEDGSITAFTPANSVGGWGDVAGRTTIVCADDFTSRGGHADGAIGAKSGYLDRLSIEMRIPSVRMLDGSSGGGSVTAMVPEQKKAGESSAKESSGAIKAGRPRVAGGGGSFLPGHLGSTMYAEQLATVPVVNLLLGSVVGIGAAKAVLGHFSVMVRDIAQLFVAGPPVVSHAMGYDITKEELGGWHIHCTNGSVDNLAESEAEAMDMARRFLSYLPPSVHEAPPVIACSDPADRREDELFTLVSRKRTTTFDARRVIRLMADTGSFFEIGPLWGTDQITGFARFNGRPVGVITSDSRHVNGGALTADGCDKLTRHLDLCDLFHLPVVNLVDNPGFAVGVEHELTGTIRKGGEWMVAFAQAKIPLFTVIMRRSFGVAGNNYATPRSRPSVRVAWPSADVGGIPPEGGIEAAYKRQLAEAKDPAALRAELEARIESARGPVGPLNKFQMEEMIDPRDTRRLICEWITTAYRIVSQPSGLGSRPLQFRP
ncbi:MAG: carboxyl transferase domain-containing protein [Pseudomonadales bacterium]|nr:carboxyl transferase domain-containing protein [Pseudomonadales bacterium]MDP6472461.1 carboxyl transferase domain-containing protein [Pseudomonadales bacterium]MDP6828728.1 carboxyl transferase domain-containing protein [Pseudomonadales bacterium]MDP6971475.1 carboxyl transferase domain-containing protein [Pseudomonadales bacterium]